MRTSRQDARRANILAVAREAFFEEGFEGASMSTIAARLGGSKGTLYNYFKSKDELFEAFVREECATTAEDVFGLLRDDEPVAVGLERTARGFIDHLLSEDTRALFRLVVSEAARSPQIAQMFYDAGPARGRQLLGEYLERAMARGEISHPDPLEAADLFLLLCKGTRHFKYVMHLTSAPTAEEIAEQARKAVHVFLAAYGTR